jgi:hypothetical protein
MAPNLPLTYYDRILAAIGVSLGGGVLGGLLTDLELRVAVLAGALVATVFVDDALFRNPPQAGHAPRTKAAAVTWHVLIVALVASSLL